MAKEFLIVTAKPTGLLDCDWEDFLLDCDLATHFVTTEFPADPFAQHGDRFAVLAISDGRTDAILMGQRTGAKVFSGLTVRLQTAFWLAVDRGSAGRWLVKVVAKYAGSGVDMIKRFSWHPIHEGKIVSGTYLLFCPHGLVEYAANNSLVEFQDLRPNELFAWRAIGWACTPGFTRFSFGASHPFLARFGGELMSAHRYQLDRSYFKLHTNCERLTWMMIKKYLAMPEKVRTGIKAVAKV